MKVTAVTRAMGRVTGVDWEADGERGHIAAEHVVNCGGMWGRDLAAAAGVTLPLHACEHFYIVTEAIDGLDSCRSCGFPTNAPTTRKTPASCSSAPSSRWPSPGAWRASPRTSASTSCLRTSTTSSRSWRWPSTGCPCWPTAGIHTFFNGPESFTPDDRYYLGEAPELRGYWVAAGYNSIGIASSGGAGMALAQWMEDGEPPFDLWEVDIRRAQPFQRNRRYLRERVTETLGLLYADHFPFRQPATARGVRRTPAARAAEGAGRRLRRDGRLGAGQLVRQPGQERDLPLRLGPPELVREPARRASGLSDRRRAPRHVLLRQDSASRAATPSTFCSGSARTRSTWPWAGSSTRRC